MTRRAFLGLATLFLGLTVSLHGTETAQAAAAMASAGESYVEFIIGDRTKDTRKWGHVSLRVVGSGVDNIFDFGRYGKMWGRKNASEGDPMLRVWNAGQFGSYRAYHLKDGGTTRRYKFASNAERNGRILAYFNQMTKGLKPVAVARQFSMYNTAPNYPTFDAVTVNCTTVSILAFMQGFPEFNVDDTRYAKARTLEWYMANEARLINVENGHWLHVWWPLDLMALIEEQFVARGLARVSLL